MSVTTHERPGVYSEYDASSVVQGRQGRKMVGMAAIHATAPAGVPQTVTSYEGALIAFGSTGGQDMTELIRLALKNGAAGVVAVPVADDEGYEAAFAALAAMDDIGVVICDSVDREVQQSLRDSAAASAARRERIASVEKASGAQRERIGVVSGGASETAAKLVERAGKLNSERVVLVAPGGTDEEGKAVSGLSLAAAVAGAIAGTTDPALPLGGAVLSGLYGLETTYGDNDLDLLIRGGVTPAERTGGVTSVVRGVTTRTTTDGTADTTWRELSTILVVDDVIPGIRSALRSKFHRAKNTEQSRGAIRSQVVLELENRKEREIISGYDNVAVSADPDNPTVCQVEFSFSAAQGLNQIWLTAHITV